MLLFKLKLPGYIVHALICCTAFYYFIRGNSSGTSRINIFVKLNINLLSMLTPQY